MTAPLPPGHTRPASPQPGERDEPVDLMARLRASVEQARAEFATTVAEGAGAGEEAWRVPLTPSHQPGSEGWTADDLDAPAPSAGQDTGQMRDEMQESLSASLGLSGYLTGMAADALLDGPLRQLIDQRDQAREQVQTHREALEQARTLIAGRLHLGPTSLGHLSALLDFALDPS